jgi:hypothetical protein
MYSTFTQPKRQNGMANWPGRPAGVRIPCGVDADASHRLWEANG